MSQSTGTGTDFFSPMIIFGTDVLVLVLVQFSSTDSVLVLIPQVLSQSVPVPTTTNTIKKQQGSHKKFDDHEVFQNVSKVFLKF